MFFIEFYKNFNSSYFTPCTIPYCDNFNTNNLRDYNAIEIESFNFIK